MRIVTGVEASMMDLLHPSLNQDYQKKEDVEVPSDFGSMLDRELEKQGANPAEVYEKLRKNNKL